MLCLVLTPFAQLLLFLSALPRIPDTPPFQPFVILALVVPFGCYLWGLHDARILPQTARRWLHVAASVAIAAGLTVAGFATGLMALAAEAAGY